MHRRGTWKADADSDTDADAEASMESEPLLCPFVRPLAVVKYTYG